MALNVTSVIDGVRLFVPDMIEQGEEAVVVNTASIYGLHTGHRPYGVTKQAVVAISEATQLELTQMGVKHVTITSLCPSWIKTNISKNVNKYEHSRPENDEDKALREVGIRFFEETSAPIETLVDAFFRGVEDGKHYIHTHPDHSRLILESRVGNILDRGVIDDDKTYRDFFGARDAKKEQLMQEMGVVVPKPRL